MTALDAQSAEFQFYNFSLEVASIFYFYWHWLNHFNPESTMCECVNRSTHINYKE